MPPVEPAAPVAGSPRLPSATSHTPPAPLPSRLPSRSSRLPAASAPQPSADEPPLDVPVPLPSDVPRRNPSSEPVSPLRALAGALVAVAGVLLGIGALLWATDTPGGDPALQATSSRTAQESPSVLPSPSALPSVAPSRPAVAVSPTVGQSSPAAALRPAAVPKLPLTVLNNSTRGGLADRAARRFQAGGWPIKLTGNFTGRVSATTVYYAPGQLASAQLLQRSFAGLTRVRPRFAGLPGSGLTVVLTRSFDA